MEKFEKLTFKECSIFSSMVEIDQMLATKCRLHESNQISFFVRIILSTLVVNSARLLLFFPNLVKNLKTRFKNQFYSRKQQWHQYARSPNPLQIAFRKGNVGILRILCRHFRSIFHRESANLFSFWSILIHFSIYEFFNIVF